MDVIVQALLVPLRSFFILLLLLLLSFLVRDHRDSLQVIYFKPRHNVPQVYIYQAVAFFIFPASGSGPDPDFINPLYGLPLTIFEALFLTQFTSNRRQTLAQ